MIIDLKARRDLQKGANRAIKVLKYHAFDTFKSIYLLPITNPKVQPCSNRTFLMLLTACL